MPLLAKDSFGWLRRGCITLSLLSDLTLRHFVGWLEFSAQCLSRDAKEFGGFGYVSIAQVEHVPGVLVDHDIKA